ncbi:MAG: hypothetical protein NUV40_04320, partial [Patescibacteria group bacterium]|nr:hypothetical protein [Patescibacteria group bacterium]
LSEEITLLTDNNGVRTFDSFILHSHEIRISEFKEGVMKEKSESTKGNLIRDIEGKHFFSSSFEERKVLEYLNNLINSKFLYNIPINLFSFSRKILGIKK